MAAWVVLPPTNPPRFVRISGLVGQTGRQYRSVQQLATDLFAPTETYRIALTDGLVGSAGNHSVTLQELSALLTPLSASLYLGPVAGGVRFPIGFSTVNKQFMSESFHTAMDDIVAIAVGVTNAYVSNAGVSASPHDETKLGADVTTTLSVEGSPGVFTQLKFSGVTQGTIPEVGLGLLVSDLTTLPTPIRKGSVFGVRQWWSSTAGVVYSTSPFTGQANTRTTFGVSGITDLTMGGTVTSGGSQACVPLLILGMTRRGTVAVLGDSRAWGQGDATTRATLGADMGYLARSFQGLGIAAVDLAVQGDRLDHFVTGVNAIRLAAAAYCSHWYVEYAVNDFLRGKTDAQVRANLQTLIGLGVGKVFTTQTIEPLPPANTAENAQRVAYNTSVRAGLPGVSAYHEVADPMETGRNTSAWNLAYTVDTLHQNQLGHDTIVTGGVISSAPYARAA